MFDSPALPLLSTLYLAVLDEVRYYEHLILEEPQQSSLNLRLCVSIMMEAEANVRLIVCFSKCHFGMIRISPALQKEGISKSCFFI